MKTPFEWPSSAVPWGDRDVGERMTARAAADGGISTTALFEHHPDPMVRFVREDGECVVRATNDAFEGTFDPAGTVGDALPAVVPVSEVVDGRSLDTLLEDAGRDERVRAEVRCRTTEGARRFLLRLVSLQETNYAIFTDIEEEGGLDVPSEFSSIISHEIRNPLDVAKAHLYAARTESNEEHFDTVEDALDRIENISRDVLALTTQTVDEREAVPLADAARAAWSTVSTDGASLELADDLPVVEADAGQSRQLFENLFRNTVEHGGSEPTVEVGGLPDGFYVADDGPGVPDEERDRVFDVQYSTTEDGTGLGLAIVERIAEAQGWAVSLSESSTGGARFELHGVRLVED
jgi:signal transduction histidine kinase